MNLKNSILAWGTPLVLLWVACSPKGPLRQVSLFEKGRMKALQTRASTVADLLKEQGIAVSDRDVVVPPPGAPVTEGMEIDLGLVERSVTTKTMKVPPPVKTDYTDTLNVGEIIDLEMGREGSQEVETESYKLNGEEAFQKVLGVKVLVPAKPSHVLEGTAMRRKLYPLQKRSKVRKILSLEATAYYPGPEDTWPFASGTTASGLKAGYGVVAVDRRVIPLRTRLYVEGYGYAIAADTGGAIKGKKIDLCYDTYEEAVRFGRKNVKVYILY